MRNSFAIACGCMLGLALAGAPSKADIYQWEYINPADPGQGKRQSTTLAPDGDGVDAVPGANLSSRNLTMAHLNGADLTSANAYFAKLTNADLSHANLTDAYLDSATLSGADFSEANLSNAYFVGSTLTDADFTSARIEGTNFDSYSAPFCYPCAGRFGTGITLAQLYSTASYGASDLRGIGLGGNDLTGGSFNGQNLENAFFYRATLTGADFTGAVVRAADFGIAVCVAAFCEGPTGGTGITLAQLYTTTSYQAHDLNGIGLSASDVAGADFADQMLANADFFGATLTDADFTGAEIRGANFARYFVGGFPLSGPFGTGITLAQLYSTASYQATDLSGIAFTYNDLAGGTFTGQNVTNAYFYGAKLLGADFSGADARGAHDMYPGGVTANLIFPSGHINGLDLDGVGLLVIRDYDGDFEYYPVVPPIPITVDQHLAIDPGGTLRMVFDADEWNSTISFAPHIPVTLGGTLEITFAEGVNLASQVGRTFDLFNWTGVTPAGAFAVSSQYMWDLSNLYTTGEVTLTAVPEPRALFLFGFAPAALVALRRVRNCFV